MKKKLWANKEKYKGQRFVGFYRFINGDREFYLKQDGGKREISFESHQAAKKAGWRAF